MSGARVFLGLSALLWLPYGIFCFLSPDFLAGSAGVTSASPTGHTELRAMYGGLQAAIGTLAGAAVVRPGLVRPALVLLLFLCAGLAAARLGGTVIDGGTSTYTGVALAFELSSVTVAFLLLRRGVEPAG